MTEQYKMGWTDPRTMSTEELFADYVATKAQVHKPWVGLTEEEVEQIVDGNTLGSGYQFWCSGKGVAEGIEALLKEKNA